MHITYVFDVLLLLLCVVHFKIDAVDDFDLKKDRKHWNNAPQIDSKYSDWIQLFILLTITPNNKSVA